MDDVVPLGVVEGSGVVDVVVKNGTVVVVEVCQYKEIKTDQTINPFTGFSLELGRFAANVPWVSI